MTRKHYLRAGDRVKSNLEVAGIQIGTEGVITSTDGEYVYVKIKNIPVEVEYYRCELDLVKAASDTMHKNVNKIEAHKVIKNQKRAIANAEKIIAEMQKVLDS
jgi:hypothetical protein